MLKCFSSAGCCSQAEDPVREEPAPFRVNVADVCSELGSLEGSWLDKARGATTVLSSGLGLGMVSLAALESSGSYASTIACQCPDGVAAHHLTPGYGLPVFLPVNDGAAPEVVTSLQVVVMRQAPLIMTTQGPGAVPVSSLPSDWALLAEAVPATDFACIPIWQGKQRIVGLLSIAARAPGSTPLFGPSSSAPATPSRSVKAGREAAGASQYASAPFGPAPTTSGLLRDLQQVALFLGQCIFKGGEPANAVSLLAAAAAQHDIEGLVRVAASHMAEAARGTAHLSMACRVALLHRSGLAAAMFEEVPGQAPSWQATTGAFARSSVNPCLTSGPPFAEDEGAEVGQWDLQGSHAHIKSSNLGLSKMYSGSTRTASAEVPGTLGIINTSTGPGSKDAGSTGATATGAAPGNIAAMTMTAPTPSVPSSRASSVRAPLTISATTITPGAPTVPGMPSSEAPVQPGGPPSLLGTQQDYDGTWSGHATARVGGNSSASTVTRSRGTYMFQAVLEEGGNSSGSTGVPGTPIAGVASSAPHSEAGTVPQVLLSTAPAGSTSGHESVAPPATKPAPLVLPSEGPPSTPSLLTLSSFAGSSSIRTPGTEPVSGGIPSSRVLGPPSRLSTSSKAQGSLPVATSGGARLPPGRAVSHLSGTTSHISGPQAVELLGSEPSPPLRMARRVSSTVPSPSTAGGGQAAQQGGAGGVMMESDTFTRCSSAVTDLLQFAGSGTGTVLQPQSSVPAPQQPPSSHNHPEPQQQQGPDKGSIIGLPVGSLPASLLKQGSAQSAPPSQVAIPAAAATTAGGATTPVGGVPEGAMTTTPAGAALAPRASATVSGVPTPDISFHTPAHSFNVSPGQQQQQQAAAGSHAGSVPPVPMLSNIIRQGMPMGHAALLQSRSSHLNAAAMGHESGSNASILWGGGLPTGAAASAAALTTYQATPMALHSTLLQQSLITGQGVVIPDVAAYLHKQPSAPYRDVVVSRSARIVSAIAVACYKQPLPLPPPSNRGSSNRGSNTPVGAVGGTAGAAERARAASDRGQQEVEQVQIPLAAVYLTYPHTLPETLLCGVMQQVEALLSVFGPLLHALLHSPAMVGEWSLLHDDILEMELQSSKAIGASGALFRSTADHPHPGTAPHSPSPSRAVHLRSVPLSPIHVAPSSSLTATATAGLDTDTPPSPYGSSRRSPRGHAPMHPGWAGGQQFSGAHASTTDPPSGDRPVPTTPSRSVRTLGRNNTSGLAVSSIGADSAVMTMTGLPGRGSAPGGGYVANAGFGAPPSTPVGLVGGTWHGSSFSALLQRVPSGEEAGSMDAATAPLPAPETTRGRAFRTITSLLHRHGSGGDSRSSAGTGPATGDGTKGLLGSILSFSTLQHAMSSISRTDHQHAGEKGGGSGRLKQGPASAHAPAAANAATVGGASSALLGAGAGPALAPARSPASQSAASGPALATGGGHTTTSTPASTTAQYSAAQLGTSAAQLAPSAAQQHALPSAGASAPPPERTSARTMQQRLALSAHEVAGRSAEAVARGVYRAETMPSEDVLEQQRASAVRQYPYPPHMQPSHAVGPGTGSTRASSSTVQQGLLGTSDTASVAGGQEVAFGLQHPALVGSNQRDPAGDSGRSVTSATHNRPPSMSRRASAPSTITPLMSIAGAAGGVGPPGGHHTLHHYTGGRGSWHAPVPAPAHHGIAYPNPHLLAAAVAAAQAQSLGPYPARVPSPSPSVLSATPTHAHALRAGMLALSSSNRSSMGYGITGPLPAPDGVSSSNPHTTSVTIPTADILGFNNSRFSSGYAPSDGMAAGGAPGSVTAGGAGAAGTQLPAAGSSTRSLMHQATSTSMSLSSPPANSLGISGRQPAYSSSPLGSLPSQLLGASSGPMAAALSLPTGAAATGVPGRESGVPAGTGIGSVAGDLSFKLIPKPEPGRIETILAGLHDRLTSARASSLLSEQMHVNYEDLSSLVLIDTIGRGGFGTVYRGVYNSTEVAVKVVYQEDEEEGSASAGRSQLRNALELAAVTAVSHPNIVQIVAYFTDVVALELPAATRAGAHLTGPPIALLPPDSVLPTRTGTVASTPRQSLPGGPSLKPSRSATHLTELGALPPPIYQHHHSSVTSHTLSTAAAGASAVATQQAGAQGGTSQLAKRSLVICMEYCDGGSLAAAIQRGVFKQRVRGGYGASVPDFTAIYLTLLEIALALKHLHSLHLVHCDVKASNVLIKSNPRDPRGFNCKLSDFGLVSLLVDDGMGNMVVRASPAWPPRNGNTGNGGEHADPQHPQQGQDKWAATSVRTAPLGTGPAAGTGTTGYQAVRPPGVHVAPYPHTAGRSLDWPSTMPNSPTYSPTGAGAPEAAHWLASEARAAFQQQQQQHVGQTQPYQASAVRHLRRASASARSLPTARSVDIPSQASSPRANPGTQQVHQPHLAGAEAAERRQSMGEGGVRPSSMPLNRQSAGLPAAVVGTQHPIPQQQQQQHQEQNPERPPGTPTHIAPELILGATAGAPLDIYSFGILMAELVMGPDIVYLGVRPGDLLQRVAREELRPEIPTYIPADYRDLARLCWQQDPCTRPTATELVNHIKAFMRERGIIARPGQGFATHGRASASALTMSSTAGHGAATPGGGGSAAAPTSPRALAEAAAACAVSPSAFADGASNLMRASSVAYPGGGGYATGGAASNKSHRYSDAWSHMGLGSAAGGGLRPAGGSGHDFPSTPWPPNSSTTSIPLLSGAIGGGGGGADGGDAGTGGATHHDVPSSPRISSLDIAMHNTLLPYTGRSSPYMPGSAAGVVELPPPPRQDVLQLAHALGSTPPPALMGLAAPAEEPDMDFPIHILS